ncbi:MAG: GDP-mannose 4,6-dehydratase [Anaerolineaceae bacterium]|nr:GDP-mannose 4,6-dehydratase [Anaerolineaceae bacterium]
MDLKNKKILITGGLGFIGSNLAHRCLDLGADVTVYDNLDPHSGGNLFNIEDIRKDIQICYHDILDFDRLIEQTTGKDIVFNCAASTSHPFSMREPWLDLDVNSRSVINLLETLRRFNREAKFIQIGTSTQLGKLRYQPADEDHPEFPLDIYSANKSVSEKYVLIYAHAYHLRAAVVRLSNVYGPRASIHSPDFTFNNYFIGLALQGNAITIYGDGEQKRNLIYVGDVAEALIGTALNEQMNGSTFFAVGDEHFSISEIAQTIINSIGKGSVVHIPWPNDRKSTEAGDVMLSNARIKKILGWQPQETFSKGMEKTRDYYFSCLDKYLR